MKKKRIKKNRYMCDLFWERIKPEKIPLTDKDGNLLITNTWIEEKGDRLHRFRMYDITKINTPEIDIEVEEINN